MITTGSVGMDNIIIKLAKLIDGMFYCEGGGYDSDDVHEEIQKAFEIGVQSAAEVIAAAEKALESVSFECDGKADCDDGLDGVANVPNLAMRCEMAVGPALALITKWKEANRE